MSGIRLRRIRLDGIGPSGARFDPLTIDLTSGGAASPVALLFLENGGGKSVLLRLVFSVVLPGRRNVVGGARLADYVLSRDVGHIICEWEIDDGTQVPSLFVTGKVLEWRGGHRSANADNLKESWYSFSPYAGVIDFDTLATRKDGRRLSRAGFLTTLAEAQRATPALNLVVEHSPGAWREHLLKNTPLDPVLFRYQRAMNVDESDADELFSRVTTGEAFVRFLLRAAADPDELREFGALLDAYARQAASRDALELERVFAETALDALGPVADAEAARRAAADLLAEADRRADLFARSLLAEVARTEGEASVLNANAAAAKERAETAGSESNRFESFTRELRRQAALFDLADAEALAAEAEAAVRTAEVELAGWEAVPTIANARRANVTRRELTAAVEQAASDEAPYRAARDRAAIALLAAVEREKAALEERACIALREADELDARAESARRATIDAEAQAAASIAEAKQLGERITAADEERSHLVTGGILGTAESAEAARDRHLQAATFAGERLAAIAERRAAIVGSQRSLNERDRDLADRLVEADTELRAAEDHLQRFKSEASAVLGADRVVALVGDGVELWPAVDRVTQILNTDIAAAETRVRDLAVAGKDDEVALESLGTEGRLPPSADVQAALEALRGARVPATAGWSWLSQLNQDARDRALSSNPLLAGGVIVTNPAALDRARSVLTDAGLDVRSIVAVGPAADLEAGSPAVATLVVPPNPALYDESLADAESRRLAARVDASSREREELTSAADADRRLRDRIADIVRRWSADAVATCEDRVRQLRTEVQEMRGERSALAADLRRLEGEFSDLETEASTQRTAEQTARTAASEADRLTEREADADRARERIPALDLHASTRREDAMRESRAETKARGDASVKRNEAAELRRHRADLDRVLEDVPITRTPAEPDGISRPVDDLRARFDAAAGALARVAVGDDLHSALHAAEADEAAATAKVMALSAAVRDAAERLASTGAAATPASLDEARRSAAVTFDRCRSEDKAASNMVALAQKEVETTSRRDERTGRAHAELPDEWKPTDATTARRLSEDVGELARAARSRQLAAEGEQRQAINAAQTSRTRAQVLKAHAARLGRRDAPPEDLVGVAPWSGSEDTAATQADSLGEAHSEAATALDDATRRLERAVEYTRRVANESRFA
ncbi:MAG: hypothetical protein GEU28_12370, partial [Dehalococcoidia bacterium]|nr:hypothetical protein [Dehalococcoidia bacterium]